MENIIQNAKQLPNYKILMLLSFAYLTLDLMANVLLYKVVKIGPGIAPGGIFLLPLIYLLEDVIAEIYGYRVSRQLIWYVFLFDLIFNFTVFVIIKAPSPSYWHLQSAYNSIFNPLMHASIGASIAILMGRFINIYVITKLKVLMLGRYFILRSIFSTIIGQTAALLMAAFVIYHGVLNGKEIIRLILTDWTIRFTYIMLGSFPAFLLVSLIRRYEKIDIYDVKTNFNPFLL